MTVSECSRQDAGDTTLEVEMGKKVNKVKRLKFWASSNETRTFELIGSIVPKTVCGMMDLMMHKSDLQRFCKKTAKDQSKMCDFMVRMERTFGGEWSIDEEKES